MIPHYSITGVIGVDAAKTVNLVIGIVLAVLIALILLGGIKRIGQVTEKLVPFMAVIYVLLAAGVVLLNLKIYHMYLFQFLKVHLHRHLLPEGQSETSLSV